MLDSDQESVIVDVTKYVRRQLWNDLQEFGEHAKGDAGKIEFNALREPQVVDEHSLVGEWRSGRCNRQSDVPNTFIAAGY